MKEKLKLYEVKHSYIFVEELDDTRTIAHIDDQRIVIPTHILNSLFKKVNEDDD